ncbi:MAG: ATP-binding protein [Chloroflexota bacterium]|nr:ATP-binding protein [Chloroflexota bacterium]
MNPSDELLRENLALRQRLALLSQASLSINESLHFDTVLQGVLDSARSLTGARYGVITLHDEAGNAGDFLSSGMTNDEAEKVWSMPGWPEHFQYLSRISGPLRIPDLLGHLRDRGLPEMAPPLAVSPRVSFLAAPVLHLGQRVGSVFLAEKEDGQEFTPEDEETLALFAAQAALAIANARRHREERRARAGLEALIETSPVGVVVLDAATGFPRSFNREAMRIVDSLRDPGQTPVDLLNQVTFRRADGREVSLQEFPLAGLLSSPETVHAEEIMLRVPDGRSVTVLLNATPIVGEDSTVESFMVTLQDLAAVEEMERLRADFLAMISHELRIPLTSIKGSAATILDSVTDLDAAVVRQFVRIMRDQADHMNDLVSDLLDVARIETGTLSVSPEPAEVAALLDRARSALGSAASDNILEIDIPPDLPLVMADRGRMVQVLVNLLSNAVRHSPPGSAVRLSAARDGVHVAVTVSDQGRGIPADRLPNLFRKFSTGQSGEQGGDTGLGLAICKGIVEAHGGRIRAESGGPGLGTRFTFTLPTVGEDGQNVATAALLSHPDAEAFREEVPVLAVEDDPQELRRIRDALVAADYRPVVTGDPEEALRLMEQERPQLALLDLMLPDTDGIELMRYLLGIADVPVIFLSAYGREETIGRALDAGAEDYVVKPFSPTELAARIRAALRRRGVPQVPEPYVYEDLLIDLAARRVTLAGSPVHLVPMEYRLLAELAANAGRVLTYKYLLDRVWAGKGSGDLSPMRNIVNKLRAKLGDDANTPTYIFTESRVGYWMPAGEIGL